jgi:hypothetical protein
MKISEIQIDFIKPHEGLIGFASFVGVNVKSGVWLH